MRLIMCLVAATVVAAAVAAAQTGDATAPKENPAGFVAKPEPGGPPQLVAVPAGHDARMWKVLDGLVTALEDEDRAAFEALMSPALLERRAQAGDPLSLMYDFMAQAMAGRGSIAGFHALGDKAYDVPDSAFPMRPAVFHLEDGMAGYFGLALDDDDRIDHFSLILKGEICAAGLQCGKMVGLPRTMMGE